MNLANPFSNPLGANDRFENPSLAQTEKGNETLNTAKQSTGPSKLVKKKQDLQSGGQMNETPMMWMNNKMVPFHSVGFMTDVTERMIKVLLAKAIGVLKGGTLILDRKVLVFPVWCLLQVTTKN